MCLVIILTTIKSIRTGQRLPSKLHKMSTGR
jgi:hypothetical protein